MMRDEFMDAWRSQDHESPDGMINDFFDRFDWDQSGVLNMEEFFALAHEITEMENNKEWDEHHDDAAWDGDMGHNDHDYMMEMMMDQMRHGDPLDGWMNVMRGLIDQEVEKRVQDRMHDMGCAPHEDAPWMDHGPEGEWHDEGHWEGDAAADWHPEGMATDGEGNYWQEDKGHWDGDGHDWHEDEGHWDDAAADHWDAAKAADWGPDAAWNGEDFGQMGDQIHGAIAGAMGDAFGPGGFDAAAFGDMAAFDAADFGGADFAAAGWDP